MKHLIVFALSLTSIFNLSAQDWIPLNGPYGVRVWHSIIRHQTGEIFSLTAAGEVFLSSDKGITWSNISKGIAPLSGRYAPIYLSKFAESKDGKVFLHHDKHFYLYNQVDSTWILQSSGYYIGIYSIAPNGNIFANINDDLFISKDDGVHFDSLSISKWSPAQFECKGNGHNFALRKATILFSFDDDGSNLQSLDTIEPSIRIIYDEASGNLLNFTANGIFVSKDLGKSFSKISITGFPDYYADYAVQMPNGNLVAFGNPNFISTDGGSSWNEFDSYKMKSNKFQSEFLEYNYAYFTNDLTLFFGSSHNVYIQTSNTEARGLVIPSDKPYVGSLICYGDNNIVALCDGLYRIQFSEDNGVIWNPKDFGKLFPVGNPLISKNVDSQENYYFFDYDSLSIFNFSSNSIIRKPYPNTHLLAIQDGMITKSDKVIVLDEEKIYLSTDHGDTWQSYPIGIGFIDFNTKCSANDILYRVGVQNFYYSLDYGKNWFSFPVNNSSAERYFYLSKNNIFYWIEKEADDRLLLHSSDDFGSSSKIEDDLDLRQVELIYIDDDDYRYYDARDKILIRHHGSSQEDTLSFDGLDISKYQERKFTFGQNGYIYCAVPQRVLYRTTKKITETFELKTASFDLKVVPNPINAQATFQLPDEFQGSKFHIMISDLNGKLVKEMVSEDKDILIDCEQINSGYYIIKALNTKGNTAVGKMVVTK